MILKHFLSIYLLIIQLSYSQIFPETKKTPEKFTKYNVSISDDYSWLENMKSEDVENWSNKQNDFTNNHFIEIYKTISINSKLRDYDNRTSYGLPNRNGKYFYSMFRKDKKKEPSLYLMKNLNDTPVEILNLNKIYPENNVALSGYYPSKNSALMAYKISVDGSDKHEIRFLDLYKNKDLDDVIKNVKFSNVSWDRDSGVFYKKNSNKEYFAKDSTFYLYYHKIGTLQETDKLIFDASKSEGNISFFTSKNKLFLIETNKEETQKNYYYANLDSNEIILEKFIDKDRKDFNLITYNNGRIYYSSKEFNWGDIRSFDLISRKDDKVVIPQIYNNLLVDTYFSDNYLICKYKALGKSFFIFYDYQGEFVKKIDIPEGMDMNFSFFDDETKDFYFGVHSYVLPYRNFKVNIVSGDSEPFFSLTNPPKPTLFPTNYFTTKCITYKSRDNIDVPITIVHKKGIVLDGNNPTLLKAYGGFGSISSSNYDTGLIYFLEKGGVFAYAEIRGGGEKGENWHKDGMGAKKINCFNDFIDAAEFLIKEKYTSQNKLAITGGSQGELLVGVAMTKRPDLFKVVISKVGVFDMIKFNKFTIGKYHFDEYGNPEIESEFKNLMEYSPLHNIKENVNYPTTLIITADNDDRVPPFHSYKFASRLQNRVAQINPIYLKTIKKAGHYGDTTTYEKSLNQKSEFYSFLLYHLNH